MFAIPEEENGNTDHNEVVVEYCKDQHDNYNNYNTNKSIYDANEAKNDEPEFIYGHGQIDDAFELLLQPVHVFHGIGTAPLADLYDL